MATHHTEEEQSYFINSTLSCQFQELFQKGSHLHQHILKHYKQKTIYQNVFTGKTWPDISLLEKYCSFHVHRGVKTILINRIAPVLSLIMHGSKVIHLIRDPCGVFSSRSRLTRTITSQRKTLIIYVKSTLIIYIKSTLIIYIKYHIYIQKEDLINSQNDEEAFSSNAYISKTDLHLLHYILKNARNEEIRKNYFLLQYDDLAKEPLETLIEIYKFMGMKLLIDLNRRLIENTIRWY